MKKTINTIFVTISLMVMFVLTACGSSKVVSIEIIKPTTENYYIGDTDINLDGGSVVVTYKNEKTETFAMSDSKVTVTGFDTTVANEVTITVKFGDFTETFIITVEEVKVTSIAVVDLPTKQEYLVGASISDVELAGGKIEATYNNDTKTPITLPDSRVTVTNFDSSSAGSKNVTISFGGKSTTFEVTVLRDDTDIRALEALIAEFPVIDWSAEEFPTVTDDEYQAVIDALAFYQNMSEDDQAEFELDVLIKMAAQVEYIMLTLEYSKIYDYIDLSQYYMFDYENVESFLEVIDDIVALSYQFTGNYSGYTSFVIAEGLADPNLPDGKLTILIFMMDAYSFMEDAFYGLDVAELAVDLYECLQGFPASAEELTEENIGDYECIALFSARLEEANDYDQYLFADTLPLLLSWIDITAEEIDEIVFAYRVLAEPAYFVKELTDTVDMIYDICYYLSDYTFFAIAFLELQVAYEALSDDHKTEYAEINYSGNYTYLDLYEFLEEEFNLSYGVLFEDEAFAEFFVQFALMYIEYSNEELEDLSIVSTLISQYNELNPEIKEDFGVLSGAAYFDLVSAYKMTLLNDEEQAVAELLLIAMEDYYSDTFYGDYTYFPPSMKECIDAYEELLDTTNFDDAFGAEYELYCGYYNEIESLKTLFEALSGYWITEDLSYWPLYLEFFFGANGSVAGFVTGDLASEWEEYPNMKITNVALEGNIYTITVSFDNYYDEPFIFTYDISNDTLTLVSDDLGYEVNYEMRKGNREDFE